jgi:hypothetical protein
VGKAKKLRNALAAAEAALGNAVERYRSALGCCSACGEPFDLGELAVAMVDDDGWICFEHESCPYDDFDFLLEYRNDEQCEPFDQSTVTL